MSLFPVQFSEDALPLPREFDREQIDGWIADDDEGMRRILDLRQNLSL